MDLNKKRQFQHEGDERVHQILAQHSERRREDTNSQQPETSVIIGNLWSKLGIDTDMIGQRVADLVARIVHEELERRLLDPRPTITEAGPFEAKFFKLVFESDLPPTVFTLSNIRAKGDDNRLVEIALYDTRSQSKVTAGSLSSLNIEICVLDDDAFGSNGCEDWTTDQFKAKILRQRENKGQLLKGDVVIPLKNGVGYIDKVMLTDNSSWTRSRHFRFGAFVQSTSKAAEVKEAISNRFMVKDSRGEVCKKHYPPSLNDDIWRLKKIGKDGKIHERLSLHGIHTVRDLLRLYTINPSSLNQKCGNIPRKSWAAITEHAKTCMIDDHKLLSYQTAEQPVVLLFNSIYMLVGVIFDGQNYRSPDNLTPNEKHLVEFVKQHAYKNVDDFKSIDEASLNCFSFRPAACLRAGLSDAPDQVFQEINASTGQGTHNAQQEAWPGSTQPFISASYIDGGVPNYQISADPLPDTSEMQQNNYAEGELFSEMYIGGDNCHINGSPFPIVQGGYSTDNYS